MIWYHDNRQELPVLRPRKLGTYGCCEAPEGRVMLSYIRGQRRMHDHRKTAFWPERKHGKSGEAPRDSMRLPCAMSWPRQPISPFLSLH